MNKYSKSCSSFVLLFFIIANATAAFSAKPRSSRFYDFFFGTYEQRCNAAQEKTDRWLQETAQLTNPLCESTKARTTSNQAFIKTCYALARQHTTSSWWTSETDEIGSYTKKHVPLVYCAKLLENLQKTANEHLANLQKTFGSQEEIIANYPRYQALKDLAVSLQHAHTRLIALPKFKVQERYFAVKKENIKLTASETYLKSANARQQATIEQQASRIAALERLVAQAAHA